MKSGSNEIEVYKIHLTVQGKDSPIICIETNNESSDSLSQELFHAFQTDCNIYNSDDASVRETEGDIVAQLVMFDLSKISISESWSSQLYNYVDDYAGMLTPQFSKDFSNMVDLRIDFYKQRELQDDAKAPRSYIQTNSGKPPLALQRAIRKSIQQQ